MVIKSILIFCSALLGLRFKTMGNTMHYKAAQFKINNTGTLITIMLVTCLIPLRRKEWTVPTTRAILCECTQMSVPARSWRESQDLSLE